MIIQVSDGKLCIILDQLHQKNLGTISLGNWMELLPMFSMMFFWTCTANILRTFLLALLTSNHRRALLVGHDHPTLQCLSSHLWRWLRFTPQIRREAKIPGASHYTILSIVIVSLYT